MGDAKAEEGADFEPIFGGGGIIADGVIAFGDVLDSNGGATATTALPLFLLLLREFGLLCILECLVSSSDLLNRFEQPGKLQACGFSPVCVRICLV